MTFIDDAWTMLQALYIAYIHTLCIHNPFLPTVAFNICCPRDAVSRAANVAPLNPSETIVL